MRPEAPSIPDPTSEVRAKTEADTGAHSPVRIIVEAAMEAVLSRWEQRIIALLDGYGFGEIKLRQGASEGKIKVLEERVDHNERELRDHKETTHQRLVKLAERIDREISARKSGP